MDIFDKTIQRKLQELLITHAVTHFANKCIQGYKHLSVVVSLVLMKHVNYLFVFHKVGRSREVGADLGFSEDTKILTN